MVRSTLWIVVGTLFSLGLLTCAKSYTPYIVAGEEAKVGAWPWMASIRLNKQHRCGGALIQPSIVLTSAGCITGAAPRDLSVVLGMHEQNDGNVGKPEVIDVKIFIRHEEFDSNIGTGKADIAILKLARPASNNSFIRPIALPGKDYDLTNKICTVTGWGSTGLDETALANELHQKELTCWPSSLCRRSWQEEDETIRCASTTIDVRIPAGVCLLDYGGPFSCKENFNYVLGGINIFRAPTCILNGPALFTNIPSYID